MKITVNNKEMEMDEQTSVEVLASSLNLPASGIALAVNNKMVPRVEWPGYVLQANDTIIVIKAACGG